MPWLRIILAALMLSSALLILPPLYIRWRMRRPLPQLMKMLQNTLRLSPMTPDVQTLRSCSAILLTQWLIVCKRMKAAHMLPNPRELPQAMDLAHDVADEGSFTIEALTSAANAGAPAWSPQVIANLPLLTAVSLGQRLRRVLRTIQTDARERKMAARFLKRLVKTREPVRLLKRISLSSVGIEALLQLIDNQTPQLQTILQNWLAVQELQADSLHRHINLRYQQLSQELKNAAEGLSALNALHWLPHCAACDPLHPLLLTEASGVYQRLDASAQLTLRCQIASLADHARMDASEVAAQAVTLTVRAETGTQESCISYWLQKQQGLRRLHRSLRTRRGRLYALLALAHDALAYSACWLFSLLLGGVYLQAHGPVWALPCVCLVGGAIVRRMIRRPHKLPPPQVSFTRDCNTRTLVVVPAELSSVEETQRIINRLDFTMQCFPEGTDFLLAGDFRPCVTQAASDDQAIIHAAADAVALLNSTHCIYLHRSRVWNDERHCYTSNGGITGAIADVCRLVAWGDDKNILAASMPDVRQLERRYAYILSIPEGSTPVPGMLESLLGVTAHPLFSRSCAEDGWHGYSIIVPGEDDSFRNTGLIRPDVFLEATEHLLVPQAPPVLYGLLAGCCAVPDAGCVYSQSLSPGERLYVSAQQSFRLLSWQLPWISSPSGLVGNPLRFWQRFKLREQLRSILVPIGQLLLLLFSLLLGNIPLLVLALGSLLATSQSPQKPSARSIFGHLATLPAQAVVPVTAFIDLLRKKKPAQPYTQVIRWAQGITALLTIATVFVSPFITAVPACLLGLCFACWHLAEKPLHTTIPTVTPTLEKRTALLQSAASAWQRLHKFLPKDDHALPPDILQSETVTRTTLRTSPLTIAAGMLACICARELGLVSSVEASLHILRMHDALHLLPLHHGLPYRSYELPSLQTADDTVDSRYIGMLLCAMMTASQAIRSWLPELPAKYASLPDSLDRTAAAMDVSALYRPDCALFSEGLDASGQLFGRIACFTDNALLLSVAGSSLKHIPPEHFSRLQRPVNQYQDTQLPVLRPGADSVYLLTPYFLPLQTRSMPETAPQATPHEELPSSLHQSIVLISAAHILCNAPVIRWFCSRPDVRPILPLLDRAQTVTLPDLPPD